MNKKQNNDLSDCALCSATLTIENDSAEHIIPNAIGGRLKVRNFICENCNSTSGTVWESKLTKALNPLSVHFRIKRQRGTSPPLKFTLADGNEYLLKHDGSIAPVRIIVTESEISETETEIKISAPNTKNLRKHLEGLKRNHPNIDVDKTLRNLEFTSKNLDEPIHFQLQFGGIEFGKSLVKSALAWASYNQVNMAQCRTALNFMRHDNIRACYDYVFDNDILINRPQEDIFHCVAISNDNPDNQLLAYIEYYNIYKLIIILSDDYKGKDIHEIHAINPLKGESITLDFKLNYSSAKLKEMFDDKNPKFDGLKLAVEKTLTNYYSMSQNNKVDESVSSFEHILDEVISESGYDPNQLLNDDEQLILSKKFAEEFIKKLKERV